MPNSNGFVLLTGRANLKLAKDVAAYLKQPVYETVTQFADGEKRIIIPQNLRKREVFIIQPTCPPIDSNILELLLIIDAARRASTTEITAVIPYFGYSRQDRKDRPRVPISASLIAGLIEYSGADRIVTVDLHAEQEQGFTKCPWDNLYASYSLISILKKAFPKNLIVASPDKGGVLKATFYAQKLNAEGIAIVFKQRDVQQKNVSETLDMIGDVKGKEVLLVDDMIDTGGTLCNAANLLKKKGAKSISAVATHGLFSELAIERINNSPLETVYITDTVSLTNKTLKNPKIKIISVAKLLAEAIRCIYTGDSISERLIPSTGNKI